MIDNAVWTEPGSAPWRRTVHAHIGELETIAKAFYADRRAELDRREAASRDSEQERIDALKNGIDAHLDAARAAVGRRSLLLRLRYGLTGADVEGAMSHYTAAEVLVLRLAPTPYEQALMPSLLALTRLHLARGDPRRERMEQLARRGLSFSPADGIAVAAIVGDVGKVARREIARVRSFRNLLLAFAGLLLVLAFAVGAFGALAPEKLPLCFEPSRLIVCPTSEKPVVSADVAAEARMAEAAARERQQEAESELDADAAAAAPAPQRSAAQRRETAERARALLIAAAAREREAIDAAATDGKMRADVSSRWDVPVVLFVGLLAGAVAAAASLRHSRGTAIPFALPIALALLKPPTGALTAFLGIELMRGGFVPGLSALDSSAQIVAWAIVFGSSQELLTRLVDQKGGTVIDDVRPNRTEDER